METLPALTKFHLRHYDEEASIFYLQIFRYYEGLRDAGTGYSAAVQQTAAKFYRGANTVRNIITLINKYPDKGINKETNPAVSLNKDE